jgi:hypothetical protein
MVVAEALPVTVALLILALLEAAVAAQEALDQLALVKVVFQAVHILGALVGQTIWELAVVLAV